MATTSLPAPVQEAINDEAKREVMRTVLRESLTRYRREIMDMDERELLWNRIVRLRKQLGLA